MLDGAPKPFLRTTLIIIDLVSLFFALWLAFTLYAEHSSITTMIAAEALFLISLLLLFLSRTSEQYGAVLVYATALLAVNVLLNAAFQGSGGNFGLLALCGYTCYRLPLRWAWPVVAASCIALAGTNGLAALLLTRHVSGNVSFLTLLLIAAFLCWNGWTRRSRDILVLELQEVQEQLRREMAHTEELAATRERTRIARDIHDVLAHSLTMLSVQVQAALQLLHQPPERLAAKLDDIALLVRESITESRRVVGLLRETAGTSLSSGSVSTRLVGILNRFGERTGIRCIFEEQGKVQYTNTRQDETIQYVLQEALTNAHRHGAAHVVHIELQWYDTQMVLQICDDGQSADLTQSYAQGDGGHHGLQGMRERANELGGKLQAGEQAEGGFLVKLTLPLEKPSRACFSQEADRE